jgi:hypothetical protein
MNRARFDAEDVWKQVSLSRFAPSADKFCVGALKSYFRTNFGPSNGSHNDVAARLTELFLSFARSLGEEPHVRDMGGANLAAFVRAFHLSSSEVHMSQEYVLSTADQ